MTRQQQVAIADHLKRAASDLECLGNRLSKDGLNVEGSLVVTHARRIGEIGQHLGAQAPVGNKSF
jgi:hypothetical protein